MKRTPNSKLMSTRTRAQLLIATAALTTTGLIARHIVSRSMPSVDPTISLKRRDSAATSETRNIPGAQGLPDDGEVYRTADRLREASALALAASLLAATAQAERRNIQSVSSLVDQLRSALLLPPGVITDGSPTLLSTSSSLSLRYRPAPLAIEVLSLPRTREDGPALMVRIPSLADGDRGSVFMADRLGEIRPPEPFSSLADCVSSGWIDQSFELAEATEVQQQQIRSWLATRRHY